MNSLGFRTISIDWPSYGASPSPPSPSTTTPITFYEAFSEFVVLLSLTNITIFGISIGGFVGVKYAASNPANVSSLYLIGPGGFTPHTLFTRGFCSYMGTSFGLPPGLFARLYLWRRTPDTSAMIARASSGAQASPTSRAQIRSIWKFFTKPEHDLRKAAGSISCPVHAFFGAKDIVIPASTDGRELRRALPKATFDVLKTGHAPYAEDPVAFNALVGKYVVADRKERP